MTLKEFAEMLGERSYGSEITKEEEALAKELGFVVVFGYSDDCMELRGAIDDELGCFDGGVLGHEKLLGTIRANWCPKDVDCAWTYDTSLPHEKFYVYKDGELYCVGIVCDINNPARQDFAPGQRIWVVERDESEEAVSVSGYMILAQVGGYVIATPYINDYETLEETLLYHAEETRRNYDTNLVVYLAGDCYACREDAHAALESETEDAE